jgi:hypothetical protein
MSPLVTFHYGMERSGNKRGVGGDFHELTRRLRKPTLRIPAKEGVLINEFSCKFLVQFHMKSF